MWAPAQAVVNYGELSGAMVIAAALTDRALNDRQKSWLTDRSGRLRGWVADAKRRSLPNMLARRQVQRGFLAIVFLGEIVLAWYLAKSVNYQGRGGGATAHDVVAADLLLFIAPLLVSALVLIKAGPRLMRSLIGSGHLPACLGKCLLAALAADILAYGALRVMDETFLVFGPRALLDWWDIRLWIYAVEYAVSGAIVSAVIISNLLSLAFAATGIGILLLGVTMLQVGLLAQIVARYPKGPLLGSSIAIAGLAAVVSDWM
jgi:hypothetical protein